MTTFDIIQTLGRVMIGLIAAVITGYLLLKLTEWKVAQMDKRDQEYFGDKQSGESED